eukprot:COSAG02_NODE_699_length_18369_cov_9.690203_9_plen_153_part_00
MYYVIHCCFSQIRNDCGNCSQNPGAGSRLTWVISTNRWWLELMDSPPRFSALVTELCVLRTFEGVPDFSLIFICAQSVPEFLWDILRASTQFPVMPKCAQYARFSGEHWACMTRSPQLLITGWVGIVWSQEKQLRNTVHRRGCLESLRFFAD